MKKPYLVNSKTVFLSTLMVLFSVSLSVYLTGFENHRSLYRNALITTTISSVVFFCFILYGLYNGWKLNDTLGDLTDRFEKKKNALPNPEIPNLDGLDAVAGLADDGVEGCLFGIVAWLVVGVFGTLILWAIGAFFWGIILALAGLLYWIIFRAYRLIFKNSTRCKGNLVLSARFALLYSVLYSSWIYAIIFISHYFAS